VDGAVELWVANDGAPIAPGDLDRVFDKFWTRRTGGSGLGLAICKRVAEAHGGMVRAENLRRGPRFTLVLPLSPLDSLVPQATGDPDGDGRARGGIPLD
jgi:signal transduction histidine kinase